MRCRISCVSSMIACILLSFPQHSYSQYDFNLIDKVAVGESQTRYYVYYDVNGNSPKKLSAERLGSEMVEGDELGIRYLPNFLLSLDGVGIPDKAPGGDTSAFIIFPYAQPDTFSVQAGYGALYFATREKGRFALRISKDTLALRIGEKVALGVAMKELLYLDPKKLRTFTDYLSAKGYSSEWDVWMFDDITYNEGTYTLELFHITPVSARLLARIKALQVCDLYQNVELYQRTDATSPSRLPMQKALGNAYFEAVVRGDRLGPGVHLVNVVRDYAPGSWQYRSAATAAKGRKLKYDDDEIVIRKQMVLPGSVRARAGFAVFNNASEARLISNFVLVLSPREYFSSSTDFIRRFNPTIGVQIGGTGEKDLVFLIGASIKLIDEGDLICGLRFGREQDAAWVFHNNFYFGASLDPGLFGQLRNAK